MLAKIAQTPVDHPWIYIALFVAITAVFGLQIPHAEVDTDMKNELPTDFPSRRSLDEIEALFGSTDMLVVTVSSPDVLSPGTLEQVRAISNRLERSKVVDRVVSLFTLKEIEGEDGTMTVEPAIPEIPRDHTTRERLREALRENDLVFGRVVAESFEHTAIVIFPDLDANDETLLGAVRPILAEHGSPGQIHISGAPYLRSTQSRDIRGDMRRFMPIGLLLTLVLLFVCFRQLRGVLLPLAVTVAAVAIALGLIPLLGWQIRVVTVILPVLLIAVANDYGIHVIARFQEDAAADPGASARELALRGTRHLAGPVLITGVTTIAGLLCLLVHVLVSAQQMGVLAAAGVAFALLASLFFIPACLAVLPLPKRAAGAADQPGAKRSWLDRLLGAVALRVARRPKTVVAGVAVVAVIAAGGIPLLEVDTNSVNYYPADSDVVRGATLINDELGGLFTISAIAAGDIKDPEVMAAIDDFRAHLEAHPNVDVTTSIADVVREMNEVIHDGDTAYDRIPDSREAIAQYFLLYAASGDPEDFDRLVDFPYEHANLSARINDNSTGAIASVVDHANAYLEANPDGPFERVGGIGAVFTEMVEHVVRGQLLSLLLSVLVVGLLVGLLFRSLVAGLLAALPLALATGLLFGGMGYLGVDLNVATAMLSSIMIGVGVDYTIHFLWRYRSERRAGVEPEEAVARTLTTTGRGIVFNALSVVLGFAVLMISSFLPVRFFGFLVVVSIAGCLVGAIVLLPSVLLILRPRFTEPEPATSRPSAAALAVS